MHTYKVKTKVIATQLVIVHAESEEHAIELAAECDVDSCDELEYYKNYEEENWTAVKQ